MTNEPENKVSKTTKKGEAMKVSDLTPFEI